MKPIKLDKEFHKSGRCKDFNCKCDFNLKYEDPEFHEDTNKIVPLDAYAFEDGKTYMISINSDELLKINTIRTELEKVNPKIESDLKGGKK